MNLKLSIMRIGKSLLTSYVTMLILMLLLSAVIWQLDLNQGILKFMAISIYILSAAAGGIYIGKKQKEKKFLWGFMTGCLFYVVLFFITILGDAYSGHLGMHAVTSFLICAFSGTLGGMIA